MKDKNSIISEEINELNNCLINNKNYFSKTINEISKVLLEAIRNDKTIFICGNGGSASQSQHFSGELIGRFKKNRSPLKAISLASDSSSITCIANDYGFEEIFSRQLNALATEADVLVCLSTSGSSKNIINALNEADNKKMIKIGFFGGRFLQSKNLIDYSLIVNSYSTARIQEIHLLAIHCVCQIIDNEIS